LKHTTLTDKEIYPDLRKSSNKITSLTAHLSEIIITGKLPYGFNLKSVKDMALLTGLSVPTVYIVLEELEYKKLIYKANGQVAKAIYKGSTVPKDRTKFLQMGSPFKVMWLFTPGLDKYFHGIDQKHRANYPPSIQNTIYEPLTLTCCNLLNEQHHKSLIVSNLCYFHDAYLMLSTIVSVTIKKGSVVIIPEQAIHLKAVLINKGITFFEVGFDHSGLRMDEIEQIAKHRKINAVYIMSIANFPNILDTSEERISQLFTLQKKYDFTIIECAGFEPWIKEKENFVLKRAGNDMKNVIFISPITHVLEEMGRYVYVAADINIIRKISENLIIMSSGHSYSRAFAINETLLSRKYAHTIKKLEIEYVFLSSQIFKIFRQDGFWKTAGIRDENGTSIYLVPSSGYFKHDVAIQLEQLEISVGDIALYREQGIDIVGIRLELTSFVGKKHIETEIRELDQIMRSLVHFY